MRAWQNDYAMDCKSIYEGLIPSALSNFRSTKQMKKNKLEDWKKHLNSLGNLSALSIFLIYFLSLFVLLKLERAEGIKPS